MNRPQPYRIGIDLGGTKIEGVALDSEGHEVSRRRIDTQAEGGAAHILARVAQLYAGLVYAIDDAPHSVGIGTPGALSTRTGLLKNSNTVCLNGMPLLDMLEDCLKHAVAIENDANCFAMAEAIHGAGRGHGLVFGVIMGTGCGGGIVINGQVRRGPQAIAGEWGHMVIDPAGPPCFCGAHGCVETFISGGGLEKRFHQRFSRFLSAQEIHHGFQACDAECALAMAEFFERFGQAMATRTSSYWGAACPISTICIHVASPKWKSASSVTACQRRSYATSWAIRPASLARR